MVASMFARIDVLSIYPLNETTVHAIANST